MKSFESTDVKIRIHIWISRKNELTNHDQINLEFKRMSFVKM